MRDEVVETSCVDRVGLVIFVFALTFMARLIVYSACCSDPLSRVASCFERFRVCLRV